MGITTTELKPVEQTAFLTEYARALDSRWRRPILGDSMADEVVGKIDYDFAGLGLQASVLCQTALRAKMLDDRVRDFIERHPDAVVVNLGAGLDGARRGTPTGPTRSRPTVPRFSSPTVYSHSSPNP
jgi:O-methyltransferase involved in polyketide biosynthesis